MPHVTYDEGGRQVRHMCEALASSGVERARAIGHQHCMFSHSHIDSGCDYVDTHKPAHRSQWSRIALLYGRMWGGDIWSVCILF